MALSVKAAFVLAHVEMNEAKSVALDLSVAALLAPWKKTPDFHVDLDTHLLLVDVVAVAGSRIHSRRTLPEVGRAP